jgi:hypothetical protein
MSPKLDKISNVAMLVTCVITVTILGYRLWPRANNRMPVFVAGERLQPALRTMAAPRGGPLVLIKLRSSCEFCSLSMPCFRELQRTRTRNQLQIRIVVAADEDSSSVTAYLKQNELQADAVIDLRGLKTKLAECPVPCTLVVDATGAVVDSWLGLITQARLEQVLHAIAGATRVPQ